MTTLDPSSSNCEYDNQESARAKPRLTHLVRRIEDVDCIPEEDLLSEQTDEATGSLKSSAVRPVENGRGPGRVLR